jgi:hypothetical protein
MSGTVDHQAVPFISGLCVQIVGSLITWFLANELRDDATTGIPESVRDRIPFDYKPNGLADRVTRDLDIALLITTTFAVLPSLLAFAKAGDAVYTVGLIVAISCPLLALIVLKAIKADRYGDWTHFGITPATWIVVSLCSAGLIMSS